MSAALTEPPQACIRRRGSRWTRCRCEDCKIKQRHIAKLYRNGAAPKPPVDRAWAVVDQWRKHRWTAAAVASVTGMSLDNASRLIDHTPRCTHLSPARIRQIIAAANRTPTAGHISAAGTSRRLQAVAVLGWDTATLSRMTGVPATTLSKVRHGDAGRVNAAAAAAVTAAYEQIGLSRGPDRRTSMIAVRRHGWVSPLGWDDDAIDDPDAHPAVPAGLETVDEVAVARAIHGTPGAVTLTQAERRVAVARMTKAGNSATVIAAQLGVTDRTVQRDRRDARAAGAR